MLQVTAQHRIFLAVEAVDFRKGIDGLMALCTQRLGQDPFSGSMFVFRNRSGTAVKILVYDSQGFWLCQKRFSQGKLNWWPHGAEAAAMLSAGELQILLWNGDPPKARLARPWRAVEGTAPSSSLPQMD